MKMVKYLLMSVAAASVIPIGWPLVTAAFGGGPNEATRLVEATSRTNNKAESLNDSFTDVIPPAPSPRSFDQGQSAQEYANSIPGGPSGSSFPQGATDQPAPREGTPTPDPYAEYEHPSEHAVRDAMEYLGRLQTSWNLRVPSIFRLSNSYNGLGHRGTIEPWRNTSGSRTGSTMRMPWLQNISRSNKT